NGCPKPHHIITLPCQLLGVDMAKPMRELAGVGLILLVSPLLALATFIVYAVIQVKRPASLGRALGITALWVVPIIFWPITLVPSLRHVIWRRWRAPSR